MNYIWATNSEARRRRVHIQAFGRTGLPLEDDNGYFVPLCSVRLPFNRSINAPFALGRKICKMCEKARGDE